MNNDYEKQTIEYENGKVQEEDVEQGNEINTEEAASTFRPKKEKAEEKTLFSETADFDCFLCGPLFFPSFQPF